MTINKEQDRGYFLLQAKIATYRLNIEELRELADYCNEMADSIEKEDK